MPSNSPKLMPAVLPSAGELAAEIRAKSVSPVEVARVHLDRIERLNPTLNAFVDWRPENVLAQAQRAEQAVLRGDTLGRLHGVPVSIKSSIDVAGHRCEAGTRLRAGYVAEQDAPARRASAGGWSCNPRRDQHARTAHGVGDRQSSLWTNKQSLGCKSHSWWIERRRSRGHCRRSIGRRSRQRWRRLDSRARALLRNLRAQADSGPNSIHWTLSEIWRALWIVGRCGSDGSHRGRFANSVHCNGRSRRRRSLFRASATPRNQRARAEAGRHRLL